jgi:hypothetical protein
MTEKLWELKNKTTNEVILGPMPLPENWGPIFGMRAVVDKIGNLDWLKNKEYPDHGWVETAVSVPVSAQPTSSLGRLRATLKEALRDSDWSMLPDVPMTVGEKQKWVDFRVEIRSIRARLKAGTLLPENVEVPPSPSE